MDTTPPAAASYSLALAPRSNQQQEQQQRRQDPQLVVVVVVERGARAVALVARKGKVGQEQQGLAPHRALGGRKGRLVGQQLQAAGSRVA
jgi:hypothetical protein